jgi:hypothetical protein
MIQLVAWRLQPATHQKRFGSLPGDLLTFSGMAGQHLSTTMLFAKPDDPKEFLVQELKKVYACQREQQPVRPVPQCLACIRHCQVF